MASATDDPEQVATFCEIAQADRETAIRALNSADWNLERALQLHFEGANPTIPPDTAPAASGSPLRVLALLQRGGSEGNH